jgi:uncharacterized protein YyaL (SSP411 family)
LAVDFLLGPTYEFVFSGDGSTGSNAAIADLLGRFLPHKVLALVPETDAPLLADLLADKTMIKGEPTLYICEGFTCREPIHGNANISRAIDDLNP